MDQLKLAACGVDCNECGSYKVTIKQDIKSAERLVEWYRSAGWIEQTEGTEAVLRKNPICKGCWNTTTDCFFKCGCHPSRDFRVCCAEKKINHCGECDDFPCEHYKDWVEWGEHHKKAMKHLQSLRNGDKNALA